MSDSIEAAAAAAFHFNCHPAITSWARTDDLTREYWRATMRAAIATYHDAELAALRAQVAVHDTLMTRMASNCDAEVRRAAAALADCQSVVRARGHGGDCMMYLICGRCGCNPCNKAVTPHAFECSPCSCGHDHVLALAQNSSPVTKISPESPADT